MLKVTNDAIVDRFRKLENRKTKRYILSLPCRPINILLVFIDNCQYYHILLFVKHLCALAYVRQVFFCICILRCALGSSVHQLCPCPLCHPPRASRGKRGYVLHNQVFGYFCKKGLLVLLKLQLNIARPEVQSHVCIFFHVEP